METTADDESAHAVSRPYGPLQSANIRVTRRRSVLPRPSTSIPKGGTNSGALEENEQGLRLTGGHFISVLDCEVPAADPLGAILIVGHDPVDGVHAVGQRRGVDREVA